MSNSVNPDTFDKSTIADLIAKHGSSSTTAWLEFERYKIWRPTEEIPESSFKPVQGYMQKDPYIFAWGNPLVSSPEALRPTAQAFIKYVESMNLRPVWACVDENMEEVLGAEEIGWSVVSCIYEDVVDPEHLLDITSEDNKGKEGAGAVKDLKKNLSRADKYGVRIEQMRESVDKWSQEDKKAVEDGIERWKESKQGIQIASTTLQPWLDAEHRRYWLAREGDKVVGFLILTPVQGGTSWQIKNAVSFPDAPKGTSEALIYNAIKDLYEEKGQSNGTTNGHVDGDDRVKVTFGISASDDLKPIHNLGGWKVSALSKVYGKVTSTAGLINRGTFRSKFDSDHETMYVCYPPDGFGLEGVNALLTVLKK